MRRVSKLDKDGFSQLSALCRERKRSMLTSEIYKTPKGKFQNHKLCIRLEMRQSNSSKPV